jgi:NAD+ synthase
MHLRSADISAWLRDQVRAAGARGLVAGLSGGVDSAVVGALCRLACPDRSVGVILPCHSNPQDEADARLAAAHAGLPVVRLDLGDVYDAFTAGLRGLVRGLSTASPDGTDAAPADITAASPEANVKPRLRMAALYFVANTLDYLVAGTGNRCELTIGYFTKYGDGGADVQPLGTLLKKDVRALARDLGIPESIVEKPPSAGLWAGQTDEAEMGFTYAQLERYLEDGPEAVAPALALRIERMIRRTEHKRVPPPVPGL